MENSLLFVRIDADSIGDAIEFALMNDDAHKAQIIHNVVQEAMQDLRDYVIQHFNNIIMYGCDDVLFNMPASPKNFGLLTTISVEFQRKTEFTLSIGIGITLSEALINLRKAKLTGKNKIVALFKE